MRQDPYYPGKTRDQEDWEALQEYLYPPEIGHDADEKQLIADAAEAVEAIDEDELERFAKQRKDSK